MTMAILSLLGALIPFGIWLYKRHASKQSNPVEQHREAYENAQKPVGTADTSLADGLDELDRLRNAGGEPRSNSNRDAQGKSVHAGN